MLEIILALAALSGFALFGVEAVRRRKDRKTLASLPPPPKPTIQIPNIPIPNYQADATRVLEQASHQANSIISQAELDSVKILSHAQIEAKNFEDRYRQNFEAIVQEANKDFLENLEKTDKAYLQFFEELKQQNSKLSDHVDANLKFSVTEVLKRFEANLKMIQDKSITSQQAAEETLKTKVNELLIKLEQDLASFLTTSQEKSIEAVNLEVKSARQLIDAYKEQQLGLVDENIIAVLERTLSLVLQKKLTLREQMDLVFDALERAKAEKFFV